RPALTPALVEAAAGAGADAIELGIPFSDPLADGRTIQATSQLALKAGVTVAHALESAKAARMQTEVPLLFMTYLNPILAFGLDRFCRATQAAGIDGLIVPDLPPAESGDLRTIAGTAGIDLVFFVAPTSIDAASEAASRAATGVIHCIAVTGVPVARGLGDAEERRLIDRSAAGDQEAFRQLVLRYHRLVINVAFRALGEVALAEDVAQDVFIKVYKSLPTYRHDKPFKHWLHRVAANTVTDSLRRRRPVVSLDGLEQPLVS